MSNLSRRTVFFVLAGGVLGGSAIARPASAQVIGRDLAAVSAPAHRPAKRGLAPHAVVASIMPVGPSDVALGAPMRFRMVATAGGYGHLYVLSASGRTQAWFENVRIHAGAPLAYPPKGLVVRASAPAGAETLLFVATPARIEGLGGAGDATVDAPAGLSLSHDGLRAAIFEKIGKFPAGRAGFAERVIRVHD